MADSMILTGFTGLDCEINPDDCVRHQCQNGATCLDGLGTYSCLCPKTWKGEWFRASLHSSSACSRPPSQEGSQCPLSVPLQAGTALKM